ncbi:PepSY-associated TM helix domain-containing protein [Actomonas aquatica]|uniref:PepSY-associated TM helix domain-containing protein n=1 Tax=Actomonas aquatica TaxID=2866162 RepID=A0ABZ1C5W5_9BACT|nr:PepSY-associated TM helix domain-containing protein [Opitutus sp. WL0086]WRQ86901.1 PepSY-associated TM helix domain-containing protein [Opitutus sp. WL0086]
MKRFRSVLFWIHLCAGIVAGVIIFVMSFTGLALAFEQELIDWSQRDSRRVDPPADTAPLSAEALLAAFSAAHPDTEASTLALSSDPADAAVVRVGRRETYYLNPYTGAVLEPGSSAMEDFMHTMVAWHRWLGQSGDSRGIGKAITGASNAAYVVLAVTGLYLWFPRRWARRALRPSLWFTGASGKARDWNWHNVFGFWMLIPITVMAVSGMVISYQWAGKLVYTLAGEEAPTRRGPPGPPASASAPSTQEAPSAPVALDTFFTTAAAASPDWTSLSLSLPVRGDTARVSVKTPHDWPRTASTTLTVDGTAGTVTERETFADQSTGRQWRSWLRFLHTGQALGWIGQAIGAVGCLAGCFLVYTGFALSWRRFFGRKAKADATPA